MSLATIVRQQHLQCNARMASVGRPTRRGLARTGRAGGRAAGGAAQQPPKPPATAAARSAMPPTTIQREAPTCRPRISARTLLPDGFTNTPSKIGTWCKLEPLWEVRGGRELKAPALQPAPAGAPNSASNPHQT
jgi:hypothetical protein